MQDRDLGTSERGGLDAAMCRPHSAEQFRITCLGPRFELPALVFEKGIDQPGNRQGGPLTGLLGLWIDTPKRTRASVFSAAFLA